MFFRFLSSFVLSIMFFSFELALGNPILPPLEEIDVEFTSKDGSADRSDSPPVGRNKILQDKQKAIALFKQQPSVRIWLKSNPDAVVSASTLLFSCSDEGCSSEFLVTAVTHTGGSESRAAWVVISAWPGNNITEVKLFDVRNFVYPGAGDIPVPPGEF